MSSYLYRLGRSSAAHPWRVISAWVLLVATAAALASSFGAPMRDDWDVPGARAQQGIDLLREHGVGGFASARVVVHDREGDPLPSAEIGTLTERLRGLEHVADVGPARLSDDGDTAVLTVQYAEPITHPDLMANIEPLEGAIAETIDAGLQVELGGEVPDTAGEPIGGTGELVGVGIALLILVIALGSAVGAGLPIGVAVAGLAVGSSGIAPARRDHVGQHLRADGRLDGGARRRDRLRAAPGHPPRGEPPPRPRRDRGRRPRGRDVRSVGGVRRGDRAGLADGPAPRRPVDVRLLRPGHRHRRRVRRRGRPHPGAGAVPAGWSQAAPPGRTPQPSAAHPRAAHRPLGRPRRPQAARLGAGQPRRPAGARRARARPAHLARRREQPARWQHHAPGVRPRRRRVRARRERAADRGGADLRRGCRGRGGGDAARGRPHRRRRTGGHHSGRRALDHHRRARLRTHRRAHPGPDRGPAGRAPARVRR